MVGGFENVWVGICFGDFPIEFDMLDGVEVGYSGAVYVVVALMPYSKAEAPKCLDESWAELCGGVPSMKAALSMIVIMGAEPRGSYTTLKEIGPSDDSLLCVGPVD